MLVLLGHAVATHLLCAMGCTYFDAQAVSGATAAKLRTPLAVLTGWLWKAVVEDGSELLVGDSSMTPQ